MVDRAFCMSSYLMYRYVYDKERCFSEGVPCRQVDLHFQRTPVKTAVELLDALRKEIDFSISEAEKQGASLALSGGIDSAILARLVPKDTRTCTFRCVVPGKEVTDESRQAARWANMNGLAHEVIDITWEDTVSVTDTLMRHKGAPIHSIETQIYLAALHEKRRGVKKMIFGENADIIYGGMNGLLAKDWRYAEFVDRYTYVMPYRVLREPTLPLAPYQTFERDGHIDAHDFVNVYFRQEALGTYTNACETAGVEFVGPYAMTALDAPIDYGRIRSGETKYLVREAFRILYPGEPLPTKIPMPRPVNEWFQDWPGPSRPEFIPHCADGMSGDQKWMIWCLERYLNLLEGKT